MKTVINYLLVSLFILANTLYGINAVQKIKFVDDLCYIRKSVTIDLRYENTGILMSMPRHTRGPHHYCQMRLLAHRGSSVVISIYSYDIPAGDKLTIQDSDKHTVALIGSSLFKDEKKSIISSGEMTITYERNNGSLTSGFQFTFTQVHESPCMSNEFACKNGKCILKELACNGHNHCGDNSDNLKCVPEGLPFPIEKKSKNYSGVWIVGLAVVALILLTMTVTLIALIIRSSRKLKTTTPTGGQENPSDVPVPLQSVSSSVPASNVQPSATGERQRATNTQQTETLYNRVRRSLRRNNTTVEEVPTHRETYEVPAMYPNLDQLPSAPEIGGADNAAYNSQE